MESFQVPLFDSEAEQELRKPVPVIYLTGDMEAQAQKLKLSQERLAKVKDGIKKRVGDMPAIGEHLARHLLSTIDTDPDGKNLYFEPAYGLGLSRRNSLVRGMYYRANHFMYHLPQAREFDVNPGSLQLLRTLAAKGTMPSDAVAAIKRVEGICEGEPTIGMELYPIVDNYSAELEAAAGAAALNLFRGEYEVTDNSIWGVPSSTFSFHDEVKWNYRPMPTCHPLFAMLIRELDPYIPQRVPVPYTLCIGEGMSNYSTLILSAWLLSHPEIAVLSGAMLQGNGDFKFPGIYLGQRVSRQERRQLSYQNPLKWHWEKIDEELHVDKWPTQTNLYAGFMHPEMPPASEFIHMAGVLAKAYAFPKRTYFSDFAGIFYRTLQEAGLKEGVVAKVHKRDLHPRRGGRSFPELASTARGLPIDVADYIWDGVQTGIQAIENQLYTKAELNVINNAYRGQI